MHSIDIPGAHSSMIYSPCEFSFALASSSGDKRCSKPVPPFGRRTNRLAIGAVICEPGRNESAPFSGVHFSNAIQNPRAVGGFVYLRRTEV